MAAMKGILQLVSPSATCRSHSKAALFYQATLIILKGSSVRRVCRRQIENRIEYHSPEQNSKKRVCTYILLVLCVHIDCLDQTFMSAAWIFS